MPPDSWEASRSCGVGERRALEQLVAAGRQGGPGQAVDAADEVHVLRHRERRPAAGARGQVADRLRAAATTTSPLSRRDLADDAAQQRRLAGAVAAHDGDDRSRLDLARLTSSSATVSPKRTVAERTA